MAAFVQHLLNRGSLWAQRNCEVARFEGIILADVRRKGPHFQATLIEALQLIRDHDPRRFARIQRHIGWIVNVGLELYKNAEYNSETRTCNIDFIEPDDDADRIWSVWHNARTLGTPGGSHTPRSFALGLKSYVLLRRGVSSGESGACGQSCQN